MFSVETAPTVSRILFRTAVSNPVCSTVRSYVPAGRSVKLYRPASVVTVWRVRPVSTLRAVTLAPTMNAPLGSVTVPFKLAVATLDCARPKPQKKSDNSVIPVSRTPQAIFVIIDRKRYGEMNRLESDASTATGRLQALLLG